MMCFTHWVRKMSIIWLVACSLQFGYTRSVYTSNDEKRIYVNNSQLDWWEARANCQGNQGDLFVPVTGPEPSPESGSPYQDTYYWLGAMRYSTWRWTDNSALYGNPRSSLLTDNLEVNMSFSGNSVYRCHRYCGSDTHALGLSRDRCYCLGDNHEATSSNTSGEPCPGNPDEACGDADRMSVYKSNLAFTPTETGKCGYVIKNNMKLTIFLDNGDNCDNEYRRYACYENSTWQLGRWYLYDCNNGVCVSKLMSTWTAVNNIFKLVKLESPTQEDIKNMPKDKELWIGLVYGSTRKWITGQEVHMHNEDFSFTSQSEPHCLAVSFINLYRVLSWQPCSSQHASICEVVRSKGPTTTVTSTQPHSSSLATATAASETETTTQHPTTTNIPLSESYMSTSTNSPVVGPTEPITTSKETQIGVFIGLGLGCVVLILAAIVVVLLLMRQNKLCFKKKDKDQPVHFNTAAENATYGLDVPIQTENSAYTDITLSDTTDGKPMSSAVPMATVRPTVQTDNTYDHTIDEDEEDYNVLSRSDNLQAPVTNGNPYNHLSGPAKDAYNGDYDTANTGGRGTVSTGLNNSGQNGSVERPTGDYDTAHQGKTPREVDDSYSHIGRTNKGFEEDAYDVASTRQAEDRRDDTYNHTASVNENAGDTTDYYNTRSLARDNNEGLGRQENSPENTDVYSMAKGFSDV